jgi:type II secretory ATPase GspE/PulE/Tfp pilus assembly ATPase PilB-like protein
MSVQSEKSSPEITLQSLLEVIQEAPDIQSIKRILNKQILGVFQAEIAAIFLVKKSKQELVSWLLIPGDSLKNIVVPIRTNSIVGYVASKIKPVNLRNPYDFQELRRVGSELNFSDSYDRKANIRSKQVLAVPIVQYNTLIGVFQLINKKDDTAFTYEDEKEAKKLAELLATAFFTHGNFAKQTPPKYESLLAQKLLSRKELEQGLAKATELGEDPETVLLRDFQIPKRKMGELIAEFYSTSFADLEKVDNNPRELFQGIDIEYFENEELVPLSLNNGKLIVAVNNIEDQTPTSAIRKKVPKVKQVELAFALQEDIRSFWKRTKAKYLSAPKSVRKKQQEAIDTSLFDLLDKGQPQEDVTEERVTVVERVVEPEKDIEKRGDIRLENSDDIKEPHVDQLVAKVIERGYSTQASYIHIESYGLDDNGEVRYRIDGACSNPLRLSQQYVGKVVDRIKFLASLKRDERTRPQVGNFKFTTSEGKEIELRVATIPTANSNEDIVLSILPAPKPLVSLDKLMPFRLLPPFKEIIEQQQGIILVVGPNASGKTTTLHSALAHINTTEKKIWTAEYPVEIQQRRVRQVQVDPLMNYTYADALRAFLRADPDVIMIGDMQDPQTAVMAVDAALNGHLLLSSLPANSAAEGIIHCLNMGLDPTHLATALHGVLAQRLVRTLCEHCKEPYHPGRDEYDLLLESYGVCFFDHINVMYSDDLVFHRANGCPKCNNNGYHGKTGLYELLVLNPIIRKLIMKRGPLDEIIEEAMINDMTLLLQEGIQLIFEGTTDCKELMSVCSL